MHPNVSKLMLYFMYNDTINSLVAADRYGVEKLKLIDV